MKAVVCPISTPRIAYSWLGLTDEPVIVSVPDSDAANYLVQKLDHVDRCVRVATLTAHRHAGGRLPPWFRAPGRRRKSDFRPRGRRAGRPRELHLLGNVNWFTSEVDNTAVWLPVADMTAPWVLCAPVRAADIYNGTWRPEAEARRNKYDRAVLLRSLGTEYRGAPDRL